MESVFLDQIHAPPNTNERDLESSSSPLIIRDENTPSKSHSRFKDFNKKSSSYLNKISLGTLNRIESYDKNCFRIDSEFFRFDKKGRIKKLSLAEVDELREAAEASLSSGRDRGEQILEKKKFPQFEKKLSNGEVFYDFTALEGEDEERGARRGSKDCSEIGILGLKKNSLILDNGRFYYGDELYNLTPNPNNAHDYFKIINKSLSPYRKPYQRSLILGKNLNKKSSSAKPIKTRSQIITSKALLHPKITKNEHLGTIGTPGVEEPKNTLRSSQRIKESQGPEVILEQSEEVSLKNDKSQSSPKLDQVLLPHEKTSEMDALNYTLNSSTQQSKENILPDNLFLKKSDFFTVNKNSANYPLQNKGIQKVTKKASVFERLAKKTPKLVKLARFNRRKKEATFENLKLVRRYKNNTNSKTKRAKSYDLLRRQMFSDVKRKRNEEADPVNKSFFLPKLNLNQAILKDNVKNTRNMDTQNAHQSSGGFNDTMMILDLDKKAPQCVKTQTFQKDSDSRRTAGNRSRNYSLSNRHSQIRKRLYHQEYGFSQGLDSFRSRSLSTARKSHLFDRRRLTNGQTNQKKVDFRYSTQQADMIRKQVVDYKNHLLGMTLSSLETCSVAENSGNTEKRLVHSGRGVFGQNSSDGRISNTSKRSTGDLKEKSRSEMIKIENNAIIKSFAESSKNERKPPSNEFFSEEQGSVVNTTDVMSYGKSYKIIFDTVDEMLSIQKSEDRKVLSVVYGSDECGIEVLGADSQSQEENNLEMARVLKPKSTVKRLGTQTSVNDKTCKALAPSQKGGEPEAFMDQTMPAGAGVGAGAAVDILNDLDLTLVKDKEDEVAGSKDEVISEDSLEGEGDDTLRTKEQTEKSTSRFVADETGDNHIEGEELNQEEEEEKNEDAENKNDLLEQDKNLLESQDEEVDLITPIQTAHISHHSPTEDLLAPELNNTKSSQHSLDALNPPLPTYISYVEEASSPMIALFSNVITFNQPDEVDLKAFQGSLEPVPASNASSQNSGSNRGPSKPSISYEEVKNMLN